MEFEKRNRHLTVPSSQFERFARLGAMSAGIASNMLISASSNLLRGKKSTVHSLLITNNNMRSLVTQLSKLRGAALKVGQMLSLEGGDFLPLAATEILAEVQNHAYSMPPKQLKKVLAEAWGKNFLREFLDFNVNPIAAASIGQVHKCQTIAKRTLAIKVQYPGVKDSIDSDIKNIGFLLKRSGLISSAVPLDELLNEAKKQLHQEADYEVEAQYMSKFSKLLNNDPYFDVPKIDPDFSNQKILAMDFKSGVTIDQLVYYNQEKKNYVIEKLIELVFKEIFEFNVVQTDPNFANFLYDKKTDRIVLLDFGATKRLDQKTVKNFKDLFIAILDQKNEQIEHILRELKLIDENIPNQILDTILTIINQSSLLLRENQVYDFANTTLFANIEHLSRQYLKNRNKIAVPPIEILLVQRKIGGIFLLARRFKAHVNVKRIINKYI